MFSVFIIIIIVAGMSLYLYYSRQNEALNQQVVEEDCPVEEGEDNVVSWE